jgi:translation initiation factor IF-3
MAKNLNTNLRCNHQIRITPIRVIDHENTQLGIIETIEAMRMAQDAGLDLVEVAPSERPPVCKIMDYGRYKYSQKKNLKKHHEQQLKEVRLRPKTDDNDRAIKLNRALRFLAKGDKVQFTMQFRGRERAHREVGVAILDTVSKLLAPMIKLERPPSMDGRHMVMVVAPLKPEFDKLAKAETKPTVDYLAKKLKESEDDSPAPRRPAPPPTVPAAAAAPEAAPAPAPLPAVEPASAPAVEPATAPAESEN